MQSESLQVDLTKSFVEKVFTESALPSIMDYIKIPNLSRSFDPDWNTNGLLMQAANHITNWIKSQNVLGLKLDLLQEKGRTPLIFIEIDGTQKDSPTVLLYGHIDKQPHFTGWEEGLGPVTPVIRDGKLYGRGGADDGYSGYAAILAIKACQEQKVSHPRCIIFLEADEESGSGDLPFYLEHLKPRIGIPEIIICLDSGCGDYERLWLTTTLRGVISGNLKVKVLTEGVHSGDASGVIPSSFRILRKLLNRVDCIETGWVNDLFQVTIPPDRYEEAYNGYKLITGELLSRMPFHEKTKPTTTDLFQAYLNRVWRPQLSITGMDGLPETSKAGNVLRPETIAKVSLRIPPTLDAEKAKNDLIQLLEKEPPYDAEVKLEKVSAGSGWNAPPTSSNLRKCLTQASLNYFEKNYEGQGEGGSIPFMKMLSDIYPKAEFVVVGVLGPKSNAHGPNEFLHLSFCKKLICCIAHVLNDSTRFLKNNQ